MTKKIITLIFVALLAACSSTPGGKNQITFEATNLSKHIDVKDMRSKSLAGVLQGQVLVQGRSNKTRSFQYRFSWLDAQGFELEGDKQNWQPITIKSSETRTLSGVAPNTQVRSFRFEIRDL